MCPFAVGMACSCTEALSVCDLADIFHTPQLCAANGACLSIWLFCFLSVRESPGTNSVTFPGIPLGCSCGAPSSPYLMPVRALCLHMDLGKLPFFEILS